MRKFISDFREEKPGLHALYLRWAIECLQLVNSSLEGLEERSNWNFTEFAMAIREVKERKILEDAAFFEAAALIESGTDLEPYLIRGED